MDIETTNRNPQPNREADSRLRLLYLYRLLLKYTDENHTLSTRQIMEMMEERHSIHMHRTTVPKDIALLRAAGIEVMSERRQAWHYYLAERTFSIPEFKVLIDAVQSSRFITEKKSLELIEKLASLTGEASVPRPEGYDIRHYTQEVFRMYSSNEAREITLLCDGDVMRAVVDEFGLQVETYDAEDGGRFYAKVKACPGPTFYRWIFGWGGRIKLVEPGELKEEYRQMLEDGLKFL